MAYPYEAANAYQSADGKQNVETKNTYSYFTTAGATQLKAGAGYVDLISGIPGTGVINLYDVASMTTASLATLNQIGTYGVGAASATGVNPQTAWYHSQYNNGLFLNIVSSATVANVTLSWN